MGTHRMRTRTAARRRRRVTRHGLIAGITIFLLLAGSGVSYAAWTAGAEAKGTASAASLGITTTGFNSTAFTFQNHLLTTTGSVTLKNTTDTTSTTPGAVEMSFGYTGSAVLASKLDVAVWPTANTAGCASVGTPPPGTLTGRWDTVATSVAPITGTLAKGASQGYCVRVSSAERGGLASTAGSAEIQPSITAKLKVGNWLQSVNATATQSTAWIFPAFGPTPNTWYQLENQDTGNCLDVYSASNTSGTGAIDWECKPGNAAGDYNQEWKFTRSTGDYFDMTPRHAQAVRLDVTGGSTANLAPVDVQTDDGTRMSQEWQLQKQPSGDFYQVVNRLSGRCLQVNNTNFYSPEIEYAQAVCNGTVAQRYALIVKDVDVPSMTLSCAAATGGGVTFSWSGAAIDTYNFEYASSVGGPWTTGLGSVAAGGNSVTVLPPAVAGADGQRYVRAIWLTHQVSSNNLGFWKTAGALSCTAPVPQLNAVTCQPAQPQSVTVSWGHAASAAYTIQLWSNGGWLTIGTANAGDPSYTIAGNQNWVDGTRLMRVVSGNANVEFNVYNSVYGASSLWCLPAQNVTANCIAATDGSQLTITWTRTSSAASKVRVTVPGIGSFTRDVSYSGTTASITVRDNDVSQANAGSGLTTTFSIEANETEVGVLPTLGIRITGTGTRSNDKNIYCS